MESKVLVIDGGGSLRCALVGDQLAAIGNTKIIGKALL
jgi:regulator of RNase E activity RraA